MSSTRSFKNPGIFADAATTVIPPTPIAGVAYRDAVNGADDTPNGWRYGTRVASQDWNQVMFLLTSMMGMMDSQGVLGWSDQVEYAVPALVFGSDGLPYIALQASGPSTAAQDPASSPAFWEQFGSGGMVVLNSTQSWAVPMAMQLGYIKPKVTVIGGGGGGARRSTSPGPSGGGSGGISSDVVDLFGVASVSVTVGAGGAGASVDLTTGASGGGSSFLAIAAPGGVGGVISGATASGGVGSGGSINGTIGAGGPAVLAPDGVLIYGGVGGGGSSPSGASGPTAPVTPGHGGAGRSASAAPNGAGGIVIIEW